MFAHGPEVCTEGLIMPESDNEIHPCVFTKYVLVASFTGIIYVPPSKVSTLSRRLAIGPS